MGVGEGVGVSEQNLQDFQKIQIKESDFDSVRMAGGVKLFHSDVLHCHS